MAVRIRKNGRIFCAALSKKQSGDIYINDSIHYQLSVEQKVLVTTEYNYHVNSGGEWWWKNQIPIGIEIDNFYNINNNKNGKIRKCIKC